MTDLTHWDYETDFTAEQVAALIVGVAPEDSHGARTKMAPVLRRLEKAYLAALDKCLERFLPWVEPTARPAYSPEELTGRLIADVEKSAKRSPDTHDLFERVDAARGGLLDDLFPRQNVVNWLAATGLRSVYRFEAPLLPTDSHRSGRWPWGDHHTKALGHLETAARQWWSSFDPEQPDTAPTNKDVSEWLIDKLGLSEKMADAIASILRADDLKPGRR
jgi:hypothetical protein